MITQTTTAKIYVASLSDYNAGSLHGAWIDVTGDVDEMRESIAAMLATSPEPIAEEWAVHDYDDFPNMGEYPDLAKLCAVADVMEEVNENGLGDAFTAWIDQEGPDAAERFKDAYLGCYDDESDCAHDYVESTGMFHGVDESITNYFDYDAFARDLFMNLDSIPAPGVGIYVFDPNR